MCRLKSQYIRQTAVASLIIIFSAVMLAGCTLPGAPAVKAPVPSNIASDYQKPKIKFAFKKGKISSNLEKILNEAYTKGSDLPLIEIITIPEEKYDETLNMLLTSGDGPDVFEASSQWIDGYITKNWLLSLKSYCTEDFLKRFPEWKELYMPNGNFPGEIYSLPSSQTTLRLIYNKSLFRLAGLDDEHPPRTMDELKEYALKISLIDDGFKQYGFALSAGDGRKCFEQLMEGANTFSGVYVYNFREGRYELQVYSKWLSAIREMKNNESLFPGEAILREENALVQFMDGNIGMMYVSSTAPRDMQYITQKTSKYCDWAVALPPALNEASYGKGRISIIPSTFYCVNNRSKNKNDSVKLWEYLYSKEYLKEMFTYGDLIPATSDAMESRKFKPGLEKLNDFLPSEFDSVHPVIPKVIDDWPRFDTYIAAVTGTKSIEEILKSQNDDLNYECNMILDSGIVDNNDYKSPEFDWLYPLKR